MGPESVLGLGDHTNHLDETHNGAKNDSSEKEPVGVQPVVQQFPKQQADDNGGGNDERDLRVACPDHRGVVGLAVLALVRHVANLSPCAHESRNSRCRRLTRGSHPDIIEVRGGAVW